jgi:hypothetical protein
VLVVERTVRVLAKAEQLFICVCGEPLVDPISTSTERTKPASCSWRIAAFSFRKQFGAVWAAERETGTAPSLLYVDDKASVTEYQTTRGGFGDLDSGCWRRYFLKQRGRGRLRLAAKMNANSDRVCSPGFEPKSLVTPAQHNM